MSVRVPHEPSPSQRSPGCAASQLTRGSLTVGHSETGTGLSCSPSSQEGGSSTQSSQPVEATESSDVQEISDQIGKDVPTTPSPEPLNVRPSITSLSYRASVENATILTTEGRCSSVTVQPSSFAYDPGYPGLLTHAPSATQSPSTAQVVEVPDVARPRSFGECSELALSQSSPKLTQASRRMMAGAWRGIFGPRICEDGKPHHPTSLVSFSTSAFPCNHSIDMLMT